MQQIRYGDTEKLKQLLKSPPDFGYAKDYKDKYEIGETIGKGGFGNVYKVTHKPTGKIYASKEIVKLLNTPDLQLHVLE